MSTTVALVDLATKRAQLSPDGPTEGPS